MSFPSTFILMHFNNITGSLPFQYTRYYGDLKCRYMEVEMFVHVHEVFYIHIFGSSFPGMQRFKQDLWWIMNCLTGKATGNGAMFGQMITNLTSCSAYLSDFICSHQLVEMFLLGTPLILSSFINCASYGQEPFCMMAVFILTFPYKIFAARSVLQLMFVWHFHLVFLI